MYFAKSGYSIIIRGTIRDSGGSLRRSHGYMKFWINFYSYFIRNKSIEIFNRLELFFITHVQSRSVPWKYLSAGEFEWKRKSGSVSRETVVVPRSASLREWRDYRRLPECEKKIIVMTCGKLDAATEPIWFFRSFSLLRWNQAEAENIYAESLPAGLRADSPGRSLGKTPPWGIPRLRESLEWPTLRQKNRYNATHTHTHEGFVTARRSYNFCRS